MAEIELYDYQQQALEKVEAAYAEGTRRVCFVVPCGGGKTVMAAQVIKQLVNRGERVLFLVHRRELLEQTAATFQRYGIGYGEIVSGRRVDMEAACQLASVQTLSRRLTVSHYTGENPLPAPDFIICDECHHILANSYKQILAEYPEARLLGLTATPIRAGKVTLHDAFDVLVLGPSTSELINSGHLTHFKYYGPILGVNLEGLRTRYGEYVERELYDRMNKPKITGDIIEHYREKAAGKSALCYCVNVEHSREMSEKFNEAGIRSAHCDYRTPGWERAKIIEGFRTGRVKVLCNVDLFGEGFDVPNVEACILARPTRSVSVYVQQAMRCLRIDRSNPGKVGLILDAVENWRRFGQLDAIGEWSLEATEQEPGEAPMKTCPECSALVALNAAECPECGYEFECNGRQPPVKVPGELVKQYSSDGDLPYEHTIEFFVKVEEQKSYKSGWAAFEALKYVRNEADCIHIAEVMGYKRGWGYYHWRDLHTIRDNCGRHALRKVVE